MTEPAILITKAVHFAADKHRDQRRKGEDAIPYINHPAEVAELLAKHTDGKDTILILGGLLHDTVEDTETTFEELEREFGKEVADLVAEVTDDKSLPKMERKRLQVEHAPHTSERARQIKLADKISNLQSILEVPPSGWDNARKVEYFEWAKKVTDGCRGVNEGLEKAFDEVYERGMAALTPANDGSGPKKKPERGFGL